MDIYREVFVVLFELSYCCIFLYFSRVFIKGIVYFHILFLHEISFYKVLLLHFL